MNKFKEKFISIEINIFNRTVYMCGVSSKAVMARSVEHVSFSLASEGCWLATVDARSARRAAGPLVWLGRPHPVPGGRFEAWDSSTPLHSIPADRASKFRLIVIKHPPS